MSKTKRKWIVLDYSADGSLRAEDIPFDASSSIKDKLDNLGWLELANMWTSEPTLTASIASGDVYTYTYGTPNYYRLDPQPYVSTSDQFFSDFDGTNLTGLLATRGQAI